MKEFILHWGDGQDEKARGATISQAFTNMGYGAGALGALDYYEETFESKIWSLFKEDKLPISEIADQLDTTETKVLNVLNDPCCETKFNGT